jgi:hypothetical protein
MKNSISIVFCSLYVMLLLLLSSHLIPRTLEHRNTMVPQFLGDSILIMWFLMNWTLHVRVGLCEFISCISLQFSLLFHARQLLIEPLLHSKFMIKIPKIPNNFLVSFVKFLCILHDKF